MDQGGEDGADTDTSTGKTDGGKTGTLHLGSSEDGHGRGLGDDTAGLHGVAGDGGGHAGAGGAVKEQATMTSGRLTSLADDGARDAS